MNTGLLFEITAIIMGVVYTAYLLYFRLSRVQLHKYQKLTGSTDTSAYLKMFSKTRLGIAILATLIFVIDLIIRLAHTDRIDVGGIVLFTGLILLVGVSTFVVVYSRLLKEKG